MTLGLDEPKKEKKDKDNSDSDAEPELVAVSWNEKETDGWALTVEYPLVACSDKARPQELHLMHLTNGMQERVILAHSKLDL